MLHTYKKKHKLGSRNKDVVQVGQEPLPLSCSKTSTIVSPAFICKLLAYLLQSCMSLI